MKRFKQQKSMDWLFSRSINMSTPSKEIKGKQASTAPAILGKMEILTSN
jgi:hypothetical protein